MNNDILISSGQAANILGVSSDSLRYWEKTGKINAIRTIGRHRRFRLSDIEKLLGKFNNDKK